MGQQVEQFNQFLLYFQNHPATLIALLAWMFAWKGFALWRAAHREEKWWFIIFLIVHTMGILEILYLFFFAREKEEEERAL
jgi:methionyl-tRNA synthetase